MFNPCITILRVLGSYSTSGGFVSYIVLFPVFNQLSLLCQGAMLTKRDRERYRNALKDLKDYEIYKEVI